jgi:hypothetical protein
LKLTSRLFSCVVAATITASAGACGGGADVITASPEVLSGAYTAVTFTTTPAGGQPTDQKALGGFVNVTLKLDNTTSGQLHVAASNGQPAFDADLAGTWSITGTQVHFVTTVDSFVRNMPFVIAASSDVLGTTLIGDYTTGGTRIQVTLAKPAH